MSHRMTAVDMFNELVRQGLISPQRDYPDLTMPSIYRSVPSVTAAGTGAEARGDVVDAQLGRGAQGDKPDTAG